MKPEMAPWAKDYTPEMKDINIDLTKTKPIIGVKGRGTTVKYNQLFTNKENKVLVKGKLGTGKTMLSKKIAHDWAKGIFTQFYVVIVLFLDLINLFTSLEDAIVQQYCSNATQRQRLKSIFDNQGKKCLVVLDGANENLSGILSKISWAKFNFLVMSGHLDDNITERQFTTVYEIQGFTRTDAAELLVVKDKSRVSAILDCKPFVPVALSSFNNYNPMLVMFLCVLDNGALDRPIDNENLSLCTIFLKLILLVSKQGFEAFCREVRSFGGMMLQRLQLGKSLVGHFSREFGLLINCGGQSSFPHRSIELFLGALYFVLMVSDGESIESLFGQDCQNPIIFTDSLFLYFCLSLLKDKSPISISRRKVAYKKLKTFVLKQFNSVQLDLMDIAKLHPTLSYSHAYQHKNELVIDYINDILCECEKTKILFLNHDLPGDQILSQIQSSFKHLSLILCVNPMEMINPALLPDAEDDSLELKLVLQNQSVKFADEMRTSLLSSNTHFSLHFLAGNANKPMIEFSSFTQGNVSKLHLEQDKSGSYMCFLQNTHELPSCQFLTHLSLTSGSFHIDGNVFKALSSAVQEGKLPNLGHLSFAGISRDLRNKLQFLFQTPWPKLTHLDLSDCQLGKSDVQIILGATDPWQENLLPALSSLAIELCYFTNVDQGNLLTQQWTSLNTLNMSNSSIGFFETSSFTDAVNSCILPNLTRLKLSGSSSSDLRQQELLLNSIGTSLKLSSFAFMGRCHSRGSLIDLKLLAKQDFTTRLSHLDLSYNCFHGYLFHLLRHKFPLLESLKLRDCSLGDEHMRLLAQTSVENRLPNLQHLDICKNEMNSVELLSEFDSKWQQLKKLEVDSIHRSGNETPFSPLVCMAERGCLSSLQELTLFSGRFSSQLRKKWLGP